MYIKKPYIILGIGVGVGVFTCAVHFLHRKSKEEIIDTTSNRVTRSLSIPKGSVGHVLGKHGSVIKSIREKTKARIALHDQGSDFTIASISGTPDEVEDAIDEINQIIAFRQDSVTQEIAISENLSDCVFKNMNNIRRICDVTRAKISFDFLPFKNKDMTSMKIIVKGNKEEVDAAMNLIDELVAEVELTSSKPVHVAGRALPNSLPLHPLNIKTKNLPCENLTPSHPDGYVDIYVSAVDTPSKFWVQISGSKSVQLDKLATEMTEFYDDPKNKLKFQASSIDIGDIVAAYFLEDTSWYRAQVIKITEEDDKQQRISVFYLDFGDCANLTQESICALKAEFLSIPFQAIECSLADVGPVDNEWSDKASEEFEKMVYLGSWKVIMAKPLKQVAKNNDEPSNAAQLVELLDTNSKSDINISAELVTRGYAKLIN